MVKGLSTDLLFSLGEMGDRGVRGVVGEAGVLGVCEVRGVLGETGVRGVDGEWGVQPLELAPFSTLSAIICIPLKKNNVKKDI